MCAGQREKKGLRRGHRDHKVRGEEGREADPFTAARKRRGPSVGMTIRGWQWKAASLEG